MAFAAIVAADRAATGGGHTNGLYRLEILAALANAALLIAVAGYVIYEAAQRFLEPKTEPTTTPSSTKPAKSSKTTTTSLMPLFKLNPKHTKAARR